MRPLPPFQLNPQQQAELDQVLRAWETATSNIEYYTASFNRWDYDEVWKKSTQSEGRLKYAAPDRGVYEVSGERPEHWMCDGKAIYEFNQEKKELIERILPPELQGKAISDGPVPFLFGAEVEKLKRRYSMRLIPPPAGTEGQVWIEARPLTHQDIANFIRAELILDQNSMLPTAMQVYEPNGNRTVHQLHSVKVNSLWAKFDQDFRKPRTPVGWERTVEQPPAGPPTTSVPGVQPRQNVPSQAQQRPSQVRPQ